MAQYKPLLDKRAAEQMNLTVLRRLDPAVEELLATAGHVALYDFDIPTKRWSRKDVEGSLFLVKRRAQPRFQFVILNKKSADNFVEDVMGNFQCEVNKPYLLYRNKAGEVVGIWFYDDAECDRISGLLTRIATTFAAPTAAAIGTEQVNGGGGAAASVTPDAARPAVPSSGWAGDGANATSQAEGDAPPSGGDDGFWDRQVEVPAELDMPQLSAQGSSRGPLPPPQPQHTQQQEPPPAAPAAAATAASDNSLMRIFAGMKVSPQSQQAQQQVQQQQQPAATGTSPGVLPLLSPTATSALITPQPQQAQAEIPPAAATTVAAPPSPAAPTLSAPAAVGMPLLTPQFLRKQAATPAGLQQAPQQLQQQPEPAGQALLKQLQGLARPASVTPAAAAAVPAAAPPLVVAPAPAAAPAGVSPVDLNEVAEGALHAKVRAFFHGLADNRAVVEAVADELRKAGLV